MKMRSLFLIPFILAGLAAPSSDAGDPKPKYGPKDHPRATTLAIEHGYFRNHPAPDFWALAGYYIPQENGASCSVASVTMTINAARARLPKTADEKLVTPSGLLDKVDTEHWKARVSAAGYQGSHGVSLDQLGKIVEATFKEFGFPNAKVSVTHTNDLSKATKKALHQALLENESSDADFLIANFNQRTYTDDADVGHIAPVGAYDAAHRRVLILDPDREWYEPYWVSEETFLEGMATKDSGENKFRGYVWVRLGDR